MWSLNYWPKAYWSNRFWPNRVPYVLVTADDRLSLIEAESRAAKVDEQIRILAVVEEERGQ